MDIPRYRIGNDLTVLWAICNNDGTPFDLSGKGVRLFVTNERGMTEVVPTITTDKNGSITNVILWTFLGNNQKVLGKHTLTVEIVTADDKRVIKRDISDAFNLVARSEGEESGGEANAVDSGTIYLSTKLDVYRFGNARVEIGTNGNWFIDGYDTGRTALAGEPGIVHNIYTESDLGKEFDPDSKIDTFNAHAINAINNALKRMTLEQLQDLSLADLEEYDVLAYNGNAWLNVPFRDLLNIFKGPSEPAAGESFWYFNEQDGMIHTDHGIVVHGDAIFEGDTTSTEEGEDVPSAGLTESEVRDIIEEYEYVTQSDLENFVPDVDLSDYATKTEFNSLATRVGTAEGNIKTLQGYTTWLDSVKNLVKNENGDIVIDTNLIVTKDTSSRQTGVDTPTSGDGGSLEWYTIKSIVDYGNDPDECTPKTVIENFNSVLTDTSKYRMLLLRFRKGGSDKAKRWSIPMINGAWNPDDGSGENGSFPWEYTWWPIVGSHTYWWEDALVISDVINVATKKKKFYNNKYVFVNTNSTRMHLACAIYKKNDTTGKWERVSNMARITLRVNKSAHITIQTVE